MPPNANPTGSHFPDVRLQIPPAQEEVRGDFAEHGQKKAGGGGGGRSGGKVGGGAGRELPCGIAGCAA